MYEDLRRLALLPEGPRHGAGLALFMQRGMAAWMRAWAQHVPATAPVTPRRRLDIAELPSALTQILVSMALGARTGVIA